MTHRQVVTQYKNFFNKHHHFDFPTSNDRAVQQSLPTIFQVKIPINSVPDLFEILFYRKYIDSAAKK